MQALREQLNQDTQLLASLDPNSPTHHRLAARVERQPPNCSTMKTSSNDSSRPSNERWPSNADAKRRRRKLKSVWGGFITVVIGGFITYVGWGTWWLVLGIVLILPGLCGLFGKDD